MAFVPDPQQLRTATDTVAPGVPRREGTGFITSFGTGRACEVDGCGAELSRYNERDTCALHTKRLA